MSRTAIANGDLGSLVRAELNTLFANITTTDPVVGSDNVAGYAVGSEWYNSATKTIWMCADASTGAAVWYRVTGAQQRAIVSGRYFSAYFGTTVASGSTAPIGTCYFNAFTLNEAITISELGARVGTLGAGNFALAIYANNYATGRPTGLPVASTGALTSAAATTVSGTVGANVTITPGIYWVATVLDNVTATIQSVTGTSTTPMIGSATLGNVTNTNANAMLYLTVTGFTTGSWLDVSASTFTETPSGNHATNLIMKAA